MSYDSSTDFLVGIPTPRTIAYLEEISSPQLVHFATMPVVFLSPPQDRADTFQLPSTEIPFIVRGHVFAYNEVTGRSEFCIFLHVHDQFQTLFSDLDIDLNSFVPYTRLVVDPMRTKTVKKWCNSIGNNLHGSTLELTVHTSDAPVLSAEFNPDLYYQAVNGHRW